ncbi:glutathione S-transferase [Colletotrichum tofieldiae]|nr:glutathione S-transferase [Colletotrichum tofieldiae]
MSPTKPLVLYGHSYTPNPSKVVMILEELEIPYEHVMIDLAVVKEEPYVSINPNGRLPALRDPNTDTTLWESGAIIEYLVETYDVDSRLSYPSPPERFLLKQWLHFQMSGQVSDFSRSVVFFFFPSFLSRFLASRIVHSFCFLLTGVLRAHAWKRADPPTDAFSHVQKGPYFGQLGWFMLFHPEDVPSAKERYEEQAVRVFSVLDRALRGRQYLVGDKATYADIAFMPWDYLARRLLGDAWVAKWDVESKYPDYAAWAARVRARPVVGKVLETMSSQRAKEEEESQKAEEHAAR